MNSKAESSEAALPRWKSAAVIFWCLVCVAVATVWFCRNEFSPLLRDASSTIKSLRFSPTFWSLTFTRLFHLSAVGLLLAACLLVGQSVLKLLRLGTSPTMSGALLSIVAGIIIMGDLILLLGLCGVLDPLVFWLMVVLPLLVGAVAHRIWLGDLWHDTKSAISEIHFGKFEWALLAIGVIAVLINLVAAFIPPFEWDTTKYHLACPKEYMQRGRIEFLPHNFYASMPSLMNMHYLWGLVVGSGGHWEKLIEGADGIPHLLNWAMQLLTALAVFALARERFGAKAGLYGACAFLVSPSLYFFSTSATVDLAVAFFATVAISEVWRAIEKEDKKSLTRGAIAVGAALSTKYIAAMIVAVPLGLTLLFFLRRAPSRAILYFAILTAVSLLVVSPWLIKNYMATGNPVYPLLHQIFPTPYWDETARRVFDNEHIAPFTHQGDNRDLWYNLGLLGRGVFAAAWALPLVFLLGDLRRKITFAGIATLLAAALWLTTMIPVWRYIFAYLPLVYLLAAACLLQAHGGQPVSLAIRVTFLCLGFVAVCLGTVRDSVKDMNFSAVSKAPLNSCTIATGQISRDEFNQRAFPAIAWMNRNLPENTKVLYIAEARAYCANHVVLYTDSCDQNVSPELVALQIDPQSFADQLHRADIVHVYVNEQILNWWCDDYGYLRGKRETHTRFLDMHTHVLFSKQGNYTLPFWTAGGTLYQVNPYATGTGSQL